jgi:hypothetical protein
MLLDTGAYLPGLELAAGVRATIVGKPQACHVPCRAGLPGPVPADAAPGRIAQAHAITLVGKVAGDVEPLVAVRFDGVTPLVVGPLLPDLDDEGAA